jgi:hypothetical protein
MGFLHVGQSGASARNVSSSSMIAQTSENKTGGGTMKSIALFSIAVNYGWLSLRSPWPLRQLCGAGRLPGALGS